MEICQVQKDIVLTSRVDGMGHLPVKVLKSVSGGLSAALDPIGVRDGDWVFTIANSAARDAAGSKKIITDLTIGGIIDNWQDVITVARIENKS
ncbi:MAG TPA: carboxysome peptide B [Piscirickettsiaceae bacterium]|nr:carboxysome peptide B [Piscirickettsiaceae bacterium]HIQ40526.1 carboxysome peptide B [Sulfurivirga caldicuralii]